MNKIHPGSILIVGEDPHFCYLLRSYVRRFTCQTLFSTPGDNVLQIAKREPLAAIVLDMDMPANEGWILLRALKTNPETRNIPILICAWQDIQERSAQEGASILLRMPVLYADFSKALNQVGVFENSEAL
jgi:CheY-like chemotaxis protein